MLQVRDAPQPIHLSAGDLRDALAVLNAIGEACAGGASFAREGVSNLPGLVASELTTLSVCDLDSGHRAVVSDRPGAISRREIEVFDHYFYEHPLVREHGQNPRAVTRRIDDLVPAREFERTPLFNDYYRAIRIDHAMAVPIHVDRRLLVSFVFNRSEHGFSDRDRACLELIRPHLGHLYRLTRALDDARTAPAPDRTTPDLPLTAREREVLHWLAGGKTDRDIGEILGISPRTVHKHLQRIYEKLGVETRTAAVMRVLSFRS
ncbi:MAG TPA: helix-turn-helix transcriptional regulator [Burkholderiaceae bacterium]|nr:helix-turn-helix transcriptional regulator [Burkholderiaceae bacterium]